MKKVVVLFSGGHDSTALMYKLITGQIIKEPVDVYPIFINYRQGTMLDETVAVNKIITWLRTHIATNSLPSNIMTLNVSDTQVGRCTLKNQNVAYAGKHPAYVPYRNLVMLSLALSATEEIKPDYIMMGVHNIDVANRFPDCGYKMELAMDRVVQVYDPTMDMPLIRFPFCAPEIKNKADIVQGVPHEVLDLCASGYGNTLAANLTNESNTKTEV